MNSENFTYWMQGALELGKLRELNVEQVKIVQDHLNLVFNKVTPQRSITQELADRFKTPVSTLPYFPPTKIGDQPDGFAHMATC